MWTTRILVILFLIVFIYIQFDSYHSLKIEEEKYFNLQIDGKVKVVEYDLKEDATIWVIDHSYLKKLFLGSPYQLDHKIKEGDSLYKTKGTNTFKLIKQNGEVIYFKY